MASVQQRLEEARERAMQLGDAYELGRCRAAEKELQQGNVDRTEAIIEELEAPVLNADVEEYGEEEEEEKQLLHIYGRLY